MRFAMIRSRALGYVVLLTTTLTLPVSLVAQAAPAAPTATAPASAPATADRERVPPKVREAIDRGLEWLKQDQRPEGDWPADLDATTSVPALAVMAYVARS